MSRSYTSSPPKAPPWRVAGLFYLFFIVLCDSYDSQNKQRLFPS